MDNLNGYSSGGRQDLERPDPEPLNFLSWNVPGPVRLSGNEIRYLWTRSRVIRDLDHKTIRQQVFAGFLNLFRQSDELILDYARAWGVLGLCEHGYPVGHSPTRDQFDSWRGCDPKKAGDWTCEALERWRYYSRLMNSLVALRAQLSKVRSEPHLTNIGMDIQKSSGADLDISADFPGASEHWRIVFPETGLAGFVSNNRTGGRYIVCLVVNRLLELGNVAPLVRWGNGEPTFNLISRVGQRGLFAPLAVELMLTVTGAPEYSVCYRCHKAFLLRRGQSINRRAFCLECGPGAARQEATKRYYDRRREGSPGEALPRKRLTQSQTEKILAVLQSRGTDAVKELAKKYGVSEWAIYKLKERKLK